MSTHDKLDSENLAPIEELQPGEAVDLCNRLAALNRLAGGHAFQERDAWEKMARAVSKRFDSFAPSAERSTNKTTAVGKSEVAPASSVRRIEAEKDEAYRQRNVLVAALSRIFPSGIRPTNIDGWSADWHGCVYIDLPTGQISYHYHDSQAHLFAELPPYTKAWDGHDKETVERRLASVSASRSTEEQRNDSLNQLSGPGIRKT